MLQMLHPKHKPLVPISIKEGFEALLETLSYRGNECRTKTNIGESDLRGAGDELKC